MREVEFAAIEGEILARGIEAVDLPQIITNVPEGWRNALISLGFEEYADYRDYWLDPLPPPVGEYADWQLLREDECAAASELTLACRGRGFEGGTPKWLSGWMRGEEGLRAPAILTCRADGKIAGISCTAIYGHSSERGAVVWVRMLAVHPYFQGRGIGTKLLAQTLQYGASHGARRAFLHVDSQDADAIHIYRRAGFVSREGEGQIDMIRKSGFGSNG